MSNLINKAKEVLSGHNNDNTSTTHSTTSSGTHGTHGTTGQYDNPHSANTGPHSSNALNKADPRVDSDRDNRNDPTSRVGGYGTQNTHTTGAGSGLTSGTTGAHHTTGAGSGLTSGTTGTHHTTGASTNAGPHSSNLLNKADPRVDSDRDHRNDPTSRAGGYGTQGAHTGSGFNSGGPGVTGTHGTSHGVGGTHGTSAGYDDPRSTNAGPHSSNLANKLDPRVDSDRSDTYGQTQTTHGGSGLGSTGNTHGIAPTHHATTHGGAGGLGGTHGTSTGQYDPSRSTNAGPHSSNLANKLDPSVDSDRDGRGNPASAVGGYGQTQPTHGGYGQTQQTHGGSGLTSGGAGYGTTGTHSHGATGYGADPGAIQSGTTTSTGLPSTQSHAHGSKLINRLDPTVKTDKEGNPLH